ncbi:MAG TPA: peptidoglycan DD-metalloendopeptidase family protein, partial [Modicisalibacter sp.]|nr:peptidoglycan DD-metalloendopeptidase family protein [Modicisalibacter sp.]
MHLSKRLVSEGDRVSMGEKIALTGNTGRSTGPHLHYEVIVNNNHVDPMRVKLPESQSLSGDALAAFKQESKQLLAKLEYNTDGTVIASTNLIEQPGDG